MRWVARRKAEQNRAALDPWTLVHFATGLATGLVELPLRWAFGAAVAYEVVEQALERRRFGQRLFKISGPEALSNSLIDLAVFAAGHELGRAWNRTGGDGAVRGDRPAAYS